MYETLPTFPDELTCETVAQFEEAMTADIEECGLYVDDHELIETIASIDAGRRFWVDDQALRSVGRNADGTIIAASVDRKGSHVRLQRWELSVNLVYSLLCADLLKFSPRSRSSVSRDTLASAA